jgi:hypothetical protein
MARRDCFDNWSLTLTCTDEEDGRELESQVCALIGDDMTEFQLH